jgi:hypothetical protein
VAARSDPPGRAAAEPVGDGDADAVGMGAAVAVDVGVGDVVAVGAGVAVAVGVGVGVGTAVRGSEIDAPAAFVVTSPVVETRRAAESSIRAVPAARTRTGTLARTI